MKEESPHIRWIVIWKCFEDTDMCALDTKVLARCCTLKIACRVRRWRSVKTNRGFLGAEACSAASITSFLLHAETETLIFEQQIIFTIHHHNHQGGGGKKENRLEHQWIKATEKKLVARTGLRGSGCFFCGTHFLCKRTLGSGESFVGRKLSIRWKYRSRSKRQLAEEDL